MVDIETYVQEKLSKIGFEFEVGNAELFLHWLETYLQRKIHLVPLPTLGLGVYGRWISLSDSDSEYIFYSEGMSLLTKELTICHELAHILEGHVTLCVTKAELASLFNTPFFLETALAREKTEQTDYEDKVAEKMAEVIVGSMMGKAQQDTVMHLLSSNHFLCDYLDVMGMS